MALSNKFWPWNIIGPPAGYVTSHLFVGSLAYTRQFLPFTPQGGRTRIVGPLLWAPGQRALMVSGTDGTWRGPLFVPPPP